MCGPGLPVIKGFWYIYIFTMFILLSFGIAAHPTDISQKRSSRAVVLDNLMKRANTDRNT